MLEDWNVATVVGLASVVLAFVSILVSSLGGRRVSKKIGEQVYKFDEVSGSLDRQLQSLSAVEGNLTIRVLHADKRLLLLLKEFVDHQSSHARQQR